jgi:hypothetical protein
VVLHNLTPLNYVLALEASIWFIERAAMEHPKDKVRRFLYRSWSTGCSQGLAASTSAVSCMPQQC